MTKTVPSLITSIIFGKYIDKFLSLLPDCRLSSSDMEAIYFKTTLLAESFIAVLKQA